MPLILDIAVAAVLSIPGTTLCVFGDYLGSVDISSSSASVSSVSLPSHPITGLE